MLNEEIQQKIGRNFEIYFMLYFSALNFLVQKIKEWDFQKNGYAQLGPGDECFHQSSAFSSRATSVSRTRPFELSMMLEGSSVEALVLFP